MVRSGGELTGSCAISNCPLHPENFKTRNNIKSPRKNRPQAFCKRHLELKTTRMKVIDCDRYNRNIYNKAVDWFAVIGKELASSVVLSKNTYNIDETGVLLSVLNSLKVLVGRHE